MKASEIPEGHGSAGQIGGTPVAVYKPGSGRVIVLKNVCTHMGCATDWNSLDRTWDCPCHGSRYHPDGTVLRGPAPAPLRRLDYSIQDDEIVLS